MSEKRLPKNYFEIKKYYPEEEDPVLESFISQGYLLFMDSVEDSITVINLFYEREQESAKRFAVKNVHITPASFYHVIPQIVYCEGRRIPLIKIPITELSHISYKSKDRFSSVASVLKIPDDISKVPPMVVTRDDEQSEWVTLDGQTRISRLREIGVSHIYAYYVDSNDYIKYLLKDELPTELKEKIKKPHDL